MAEDDGLNTIASIARAAGLWSIAEAVHNTSERLREGLFCVVCVGQFKRGKSTLLNALLDTTVLPTGVVPVTSTVTIIRHGERLAARVRFRGRDWEDCDATAIGLYVSEQHNPGNEKDVLGVEVAVPSALLVRGLCLVDTPGLGSVIFANSEATRAFVPHVDAAIIVLGADPPISAEELALVEELTRTVRDIIVVLNKADRHSTAERAEVIRFTERVLQQVLRHPDPILQVSATERLAGDREGPGWLALVDRLRTLARESGTTLVSEARQRETVALLARLRAGLEDQRMALLRPIEESERRVAAIRAAMTTAERILVDVRHLLNAEQERLISRFARSTTVSLVQPFGRLKPPCGRRSAMAQPPRGSCARTR
jgi:GTP-binding protein EngB required for normal cell division